MPSVLVLGDFCPVGAAGDALVRRPLEESLDGLMDLVRAADVVLFNLEAPITRHNAPANKVGPALRLDPAVLDAVAGLGRVVVGLANNHLMDYGQPGLADTLAALDRAGILHAGAGGDRVAAARPVLVEVGGEMLALVACCAHEFGVAATGVPGVNGLDLLVVHGQLQELKEKGCRVLVTVHAGADGHPWPSPANWRLGRLLAAFGADLVVFQHSHIVGTTHHEGGAWIVHGQGNFLFPIARSHRSAWNLGSALAWTWESGGMDHLDQHFFEQSWGGPGLRLLEGPEAVNEHLALERRSRDAEDEATREDLWRRYCRERGPALHQRMLAPGRLGRRLAARLGLHTWWPGREGRRLMENLFRCEDHQELMMTYFNEAARVPRTGTAPSVERTP